MKITNGTGVALVTPFTPDGEVDVPAMKKLTRHVVDGNCEFLVVLGSTGESATMSESQKIAAVEAVMEENAGKAQVMVGCGGNDTRKVAAEIGEYTKRFNPDSFLSVSPAYNKPSQRGIMEHFKAVAAGTDKPIVLYNVPGRTASNVLPETVNKLADACPNLVGIKEASGNPEQIMEIIRTRKPGFLVFSGDDLLTLPLIAAGADGVISVVGNAKPGPFSEMVRLSLKGDFAKARELHYSLFRFTQLLFAEGNPAGIKAALNLLGICGETLHLPLVKVSEELKQQINSAM